MDNHDGQHEDTDNVESRFEAPTYPSNALRFLSSDTTPASPVSLQGHNGPPEDDPPVLPELFSDTAWEKPQTQTSLPLDIIIIGAGLGGLAAAIALKLSGHKVRVYEQAPSFGEVGAGIQVPPNSTRYLLAWGVGKHIEPHISEPHGINVRRYQDGNVVGITQLRPEFKSKYRAPYWVFHRADYHSALLARALELSIPVEGDREVTSYTFHPTDSNPPHPVTITFKTTTTTASADLIIAADGLKSPARTTILQSHNLPPVQPTPTSQAAYRCTIPLPIIATNPTLSWLTTTPNQNLWIGPNRHAMTYPIGGPSSSNRLFNLVLSHPELRPTSAWPTDLASTALEMQSNFSTFDPRLTQLLHILSSDPSAKVVKWPITTIRPLQTWIHASHRLILLGDAAHAMAPYMSQGAAVAVEDAAAITAALSLIGSEAEVPAALRVYEEVRMQRAHAMQQASYLNGEIWHLSDGEHQRRRDEAMSAEWVGKQGWCANQWSDPVCQAWTYGYDAVAAVKEAWEGRAKDMGAGGRVN